MIDQLLEAQERFQDELLARSNVVGVAVGYRETGGEFTDELAVVALVEQKKPKEALRPEDLVPRELDGAQTDVLEIGVMRAQQASTPRSRWRPVIPGGVSVGHHMVTAGTLGALVYDRATGEPLLLSNNHVLANSNDARPGDPIVQPGATDGGLSPADVVAHLLRFQPLLYVETAIQPSPPNPQPSPPPTSTDGSGTGSEPQGCFSLVMTLGETLSRANRPQALSVAQSATPFVPSAPTSVAFQHSVPTNGLDAAVARPAPSVQFSPEVLGIGRIAGIRQPILGMRVRKMGRTTNLTEGTVNLLNATVDVAYNTLAGPRTARFVGQVITSGLSQGGDSGALVFDATSGQVVGLLFGGSGLASIFTPIDRVLEALGVRF
ncbi:MAG: S1 family peptidase [Anaerolineae bacterium]|nr:S1 family peptidase [Anaerolineae bacterium]MDW8172254.1 hypothetical protein [Anaerolineae bacterium]